MATQPSSLGQLKAPVGLTTLGLLFSSLPSHENRIPTSFEASVPPGTSAPTTNRLLGQMNYISQTALRRSSRRTRVFSVLS